MADQPGLSGATNGRLILLGLLVLAVLGLGAVLIATATGMFSPAPQPTPQIEGVTAITPPVEVPAFSLRNQAGETVTLSDLEGELTLVYFGYTHCPDFCPATLEVFRRVRENLGEQAGEVNYVMISVDPERDTPERLAAYFEQRGVDDFALGLTGPEAEIRRVGQPLGVYFEDSITTGAGEHADHLIDHNTQTYLLDREGNLRVLYSFGTPVDIITENVRQYL